MFDQNIDQLHNFIGGKRVAPQTDRWSIVLNPSTEQPLFQAPLSGQTDIDAAVSAARSAFEKWRALPAAERSRRLLRLADTVEKEAEQLIEIEIRNTGKPVRCFQNEEFEPALDQLRFFAGMARHLEGRAAAEYIEAHTSMIRREPIGVCAQITPWNFPFMTAIWKIAPALAMGNTVVLKPAETTPASALRLAEIAAGCLPAGVLNIVCGDRDTGRGLVSHADVALVSFTGSTRAGREVAQSAGGQIKRLHLELGGNSAVLVFKDADLERAGREIARAAFANAGQDCVAASRILIEADIYRDFVTLLVKQAQSMKAAPPSDPAADYGPLNNARQLERIGSLIKRMPSQAQVLTGGKRSGQIGYFFMPTVIAGLSQQDEMVQQEIFGPVMTVQSFQTHEEALKLANGVSQGLACSVWTRNHPLAMRCAQKLDFGCVWLNAHLKFAAEMPHGGFKASGYGKDLSGYALEEYTRIKHVMSYLEH